MLSLSRLRESVKVLAGRDEELEALRDAVEAQFEELTGYLWKARTGHVEVLENTLRTARDAVWLSLAPVATITKVEEKSRTKAAAWDTLDTADYELVGLRRLARLSGAFDEHVRVTYDGGYSDAACPQSIQIALLSQAKLLAHRLGEQQAALSSQAFEKGSTTFLSPDLHPLFRLEVSRRRKKL